MKKLALSLSVALAGLLSASAANAAPAHEQARTPAAMHGTVLVKDTDMSSHRRHWRWHRHHHHWGHRHWRHSHWHHRHWGHHPRYYRSYGYYRPAPVVRYYRPAPVYYPYSYPYGYRSAPIFSIGFGFGPRIWF